MIKNFRTFRDWTVIPFRREPLGTDILAVFQGESGAGKSSALAALDLFFAAVPHCILEGGRFGLPWDTRHTVEGEGRRPFLVSRRDRPAGEGGPTEIAALFDDERLGSLAVTFTPAGDRVDVELFIGDRSGLMDPSVAVNPAWRSDLFPWIKEPLGPKSRPLAILDARRRATWLPEAKDQAALIEDLYHHKTSLRIELRARWRAFLRAMERFPAFQGKEISVDRVDPSGPPELFVEEPGRAVWRLSELSSGEQQVALVCAAIFVANAAIVAIEEPEQSLDAANMERLRGLLAEQIEAGLADQIILESHAPAFDGPSVIRFQRAPGGPTEVSRAAAASEGAAGVAREVSGSGRPPA